LLVGQLEDLNRPESLLWWTLEAAALGGAAVAWAVGPAVHTLRNSAMAWERVAPMPGKRNAQAAMIYGIAFATVHSALVLLTVAVVQDGHFAPQVPSLILPVLALEVAMAHYAVAFSMAWTLGKRIAGEPNLVLSMPFLAAGLALVAIFQPLLLPVYFVVSFPFASRGPARYDSVEVTW
jgi:hypothetical protein